MSVRDQMFLDGLEKQFIKDIIDEEIIDVEDFMDQYGDALKNGRKPDNVTYSLTGDIDTTLGRLRQFIGLCSKLEKLNLLLMTVPPKSSRTISVFDSGKKWVGSVALILEHYKNIVLIPLPGLRDFAVNGFLTDIEREHQQDREKWQHEVQERNKAFGWTRLFGVSSIVIGLGTLVFGWFQISTYIDATHDENRAYLSTFNPDYFNRHPPELTFQVKNFGNTPATQCIVRYNVIHQEDGFPIEPPNPEKVANIRGDATIGRGGEITISLDPFSGILEDDRNRIKSGESYLFVYGIIEYLDIYDGRQSVSFRFSCRPENSTFLFFPQ